MPVDQKMQARLQSCQNGEGCEAWANHAGSFQKVPTSALSYVDSKKSCGPQKTICHPVRKLFMPIDVMGSREYLEKAIDTKYCHYKGV